MAKASPMLRSFNAGEFSELMAGRNDIDRYAASMRILMNYVAAPQGPAIPRSGTEFKAAVYDETKRSALLPFIFSNDQVTMLEFSPGKIRFVSDSGLLILPPVAVTSVSAGANLTLQLASVAGLVVGDVVVPAGFPVDLSINGVAAKITSIVGSVITTDLPAPPGLVIGPPAGSPTVANSYSIATNYTEDDLSNIRFIQSVDVMYLFCDGRRTAKLSRLAAYNWTLANVDFIDGPFLPSNRTSTRLSLSGGGGPTPSSAVGSSAGDQQATVTYTFSSPVAVNGFTIYMDGVSNASADYSTLDYAPSTFTFEGYNGSGWDVLSAQASYVLYENKRSVHFPVASTALYSQYRLNVTAARRNGPIVPAWSNVVFSQVNPPAVTLTASSVSGINKNAGFLATDVGRLVRLRSKNGRWSAFRITGYSSSTQVAVVAQNAPAGDYDGTTEWRLGAFSDTTGWPITGTFFEDRLWLGGVAEYPDFIAGSRSFDYENFAPTDDDGTVLDDSGMGFSLNSRKLSRIAWLATDERGLLCGTGSGEWVIRGSGQDDALTARNPRARQSTARGSAPVEPVKVDRQVLYVQRSGRTVREFTYVFDADGYKSPSMSMFSSHLGTPQFVEMDYAAEPYSIIWIRRGDGTVVGMTYNRDENVIGWHAHDFNGFVESIACAPSADGAQDALWLIIRREIDGRTRRFIEKLSRFWDFDMTIDDANYVDCGLRYVGDEIERLYGLRHLEGAALDGLADGSPISVTVSNGYVDLPYPASNVILGIGFDAVGMTNRMEAGAADGTAQGKIKRIHKVVVRLWQSGGGMIGPNADNLADIVLRERQDTMATVGLKTLDHEIEWEGDYERDGCVMFKRPANQPRPFNIIAIMPQIVTQDGG